MPHIENHLPPAPEFSDLRLQHLYEIGMTLPEAAFSQRGDHADFRVRKKPFAYFLQDHHGDGITSVCCKAEMGENRDRARLEPARFYLPAYIARQGWFGLRLDRGEINWDEVKHLVLRSYCLAAPQKLVELVQVAS